MARLVLVPRGEGTLNNLIDRYNPITARKGFFGTTGHTSHVNTVQIAIDSAAIVLASMALREVLGPVKFVVTAIKNGTVASFSAITGAYRQIASGDVPNDITKEELDALRTQMAQMEVLQKQQAKS